jgi:rod shape-determining protein MreC
VGAILEKSRLQGVLRGTALGEVVLEKVMSDETVQPGERVVTSGGDQIFPKGLPVGTVTKVSPGPELFLNIRVRPAVDLSRLEEVLVITQQEEKEPALADGGSPMRAADILAQRLPSVPDRPPDDPSKPPPPTSGLKIFTAPNAQGTPAAAGIPKSSGANAASHAHADSSASPNNGANVPPANKAASNVSAVSSQKKVVTPALKAPDNTTDKAPVTAPSRQTQAAPSKPDQSSEPAAVQPPQEQPQ